MADGALVVENLPSGEYLTVIIRGRGAIVYVENTQPSVDRVQSSSEQSVLRIPELKQSMVLRL